MNIVGDILIPYFIAASLECNPNYASYYINNTDLTNEEIYRVYQLLKAVISTFTQMKRQKIL